MVSKLHITETTIDSLNQQLAELSRSESLTRAKEQHESVVNAMKKKHEEQVLALKQKLDEAVLTRDCKVQCNIVFWHTVKKQFVLMYTAQYNSQQKLGKICSISAKKANFGPALSSRKHLTMMY